MTDDNAKVDTPKGLPHALAVGWDGETSAYSDWAHIIGREGHYTEWRTINGERTDERLEVEEVVECWYTSNGDPQQTGTELQVYAVVRFVDGRWGYVEAWNDYTGWGCQDGVEWRIADDPQSLYDMALTEEGRSHLAWKP